jgi:pantothenate synthetase
MDISWYASLISQIAITLISLFGTMFLFYLKKKYKNDTLIQEMIECLTVGVTNTYNDFVRDTKKSSNNNKLTSEQRKLARDMAISVARSIAKGSVLKLMNSKSKTELESLVEEIVLEIKKCL